MAVGAILLVLTRLSRPLIDVSGHNPSFGLPETIGEEKRSSAPKISRVHAQQELISGLQVDDNGKPLAGAIPPSADTQNIGGQGITVFIVDTGFDLSTSEAENEFRLYKEPNEGQKASCEYSYIVPNDLTIGPWRFEKAYEVAKESLDDVFFEVTKREERDGRVEVVETEVTGHGTLVASAAVGTRYGIAPRADVYLVKIQNVVTVVAGGRKHHLNPPDNPNAWQDAFHRIKSVIDERGLHGKSVVVSSLSYRCGPADGQEDEEKLWKTNAEHWDMTIRDTEAKEETWKLYQRRWKRVFEKGMMDLQERGVLFVCAAGNKDESVEKLSERSDEGVSEQSDEGGSEQSDNDLKIGDFWPATLADQSMPYDVGSSPLPGYRCNVVAVGAVNEDGRIEKYTRRKGARDGDGSNTATVSIWAQGTDVVVMGLEGRETRVIGTSFAAPQVAGLAANILSDPSCFAGVLNKPEEYVKPLRWEGTGKDSKQGAELCDRLREILQQLSYQRQVHDQKYYEDYGYGEESKFFVNVAYNGAQGLRGHVLPDQKETRQS
ncbi:peptidase S8/S53 domain-containing protein [Xylariaceae sp. FL0016]|nr:peptidase S8/S53 domain-containing protein [Xylariaceae sp. FL0016]